MPKQMEFRVVEIGKIVPNPYQPRLRFDEEKLEELANTLKSMGDIQPVIVREYGKGYQIIAGERRWRAAKLAGISQVPVIVKDTAEENILLESLVENLHREDLTPVEKENAVYKMYSSGRWKTHGALAKVLGKHHTWVTQHWNAALLRRKEQIPQVVSTRAIHYTKTLEREDRSRILQKVQQEEITTPKLLEYVRVTKKASEPIKKALFRPKSRITPTVAERILELPEEKQVEAVHQVETLRLDEDEAISHIEAVKVELPLPPPEEIEAVRERYQELQREIQAKLATPEAKKRGDLFRNWSSHIAVEGILDSMSCPICKSKMLGWICHDLKINEALTQAENKYKQDLNRINKGESGG